MTPSVGTIIYQSRLTIHRPLWCYLPSAAKAGHISGSYGTTEVVPFHEPFCSARLKARPFKSLHSARQKSALPKQLPSFARLDGSETRPYTCFSVCGCRGSERAGPIGSSCVPWGIRGRGVPGRVLPERRCRSAVREGVGVLRLRSAPLRSHYSAQDDSLMIGGAGRGARLRGIARSGEGVR
jgi:hypothetical protein